MLMRTLGRKIFNLFPVYNRSLYKFCRRYVDRYNGDRNSNPDMNGEYFYLNNQLPKLTGGVVFDVGANVGEWAKFVIRINPEINLHCFEPSRATYSELRGNTWPENVYLNNLGLGEAEGVLELHIVDEKSGLNSIYQRQGIESACATKTENINIVTIDDYCEKNGISHIDLIKVDVEGHELAVFKGMSRMLENGSIRVIQFEYGGCNLDARVYLLDIWDFLEPHGFRFSKLYPEGPRQIKRYQQSLETFEYSNWVAIHNSIELPNDNQ